MNLRTLKSFVAAVAVFGAAFLTLQAAAKEAPKEADSQKESKKAQRPNTGSKGAKAGEACKTAADCDQSGDAMLCGKGKCEYDLRDNHVET